MSSSLLANTASPGTASACYWNRYSSSGVSGCLGNAFIRDSPDQTNFPGNSSFWDTVKYNPAFQGRQMRPDSLKFPVFI